MALNRQEISLTSVELSEQSENGNNIGLFPGPCSGIAALLSVLGPGASNHAGQA